MRSGNGNQECEEYEHDDFNSKRDGPSSNISSTIATGNTKDKNSGKANALRSKHSVTEQRRRSKINERFQILRDLIPQGDQKRDTASFLSEVIDYVQYLQEKVQKSEASYPGWSAEPTKLMPWRNSHWRVQGFAGQPHATENGSGLVSLFPGKFEENIVGITLNTLASTQNTVELEAGQDVVKGSVDQSIDASVQSDGAIAYPLQRPSGIDSQSTAGPLMENVLNQPEDLSIEGGTISISSEYSQDGYSYMEASIDAQMSFSHHASGGQQLLNTLTDALQNAGVDLSQASISVQINLGKRANRGQMTGTSVAADHDGSVPSNAALAHIRDGADGEESMDQAQKRQKT